MGRWGGPAGARVCTPICRKPARDGEHPPLAHAAYECRRIFCVAALPLTLSAATAKPPSLPAGLAAGAIASEIATSAPTVMTTFASRCGCMACWRGVMPRVARRRSSPRKPPKTWGSGRSAELIF